MKRMYSWIIASKTEVSESGSMSGLSGPHQPIMSPIWLIAPSRPVSGNVQAIDRVSVLVQNGARAMMNSAIWLRRLFTFNARKYAIGKPKTRQATTAISER